MHKQLLIKKILRYTRNLLIFFFASTLLAVIVYRFMPVYVTPLMVIRSVQQIFSGDKPTWKHTWVSFDKISPNLPMAVIASEDNRFAEHNGFDFVEIKKAMKENETRKRKRGASTISQQTAKNVFLWPQSSWVRKGLEVYFTFLIELFWPKERIMEVYLNSIEMGKGIYGAQAAAKYKFNTTAAKLSKGQCALIAATLPNPIRFNSAKPSSYILKRQNQILRLMNLVPKFPSEEKAVEKKKSKKGNIIIIVLVVLIVAAIGAGVYFSSFYNKTNDAQDNTQSTVGTAEVPQFVNMDYTKSYVEDNASWNSQFKITYEYEYSTDVEEGIIFKQSVAAGESVNVGTEIVLTVSKGIQTEEVIDVGGLNIDEATKKLEEKGFKVSTVEVYNDGSHTPNTVKTSYGMAPAAGEVVAVGEQIVLQVYGEVQTTTTQPQTEDTSENTD